MSEKSKFIWFFIFPTFVADDRWFPNAAYLHGALRRKVSAKFRLSEKKQTLYLCVFVFSKINTYVLLSRHRGVRLLKISDKFPATIRRKLARN